MSNRFFSGVIDENGSFSFGGYLLEGFDQTEENWTYFVRTDLMDARLPVEDEFGIIPMPTNTILVPLHDEKTGQVFGWTTVYQGIDVKNISYAYDRNGASLERIKTGYQTGTRFGHDLNIKVALFGAYIHEEINRSRLTHHGYMELSPHIGGTEELKLIGSGNPEEIFEIFEQNGLFVVRPPYVFHQK